MHMETEPHATVRRGGAVAAAAGHQASATLWCEVVSIFFLQSMGCGIILVAASLIVFSCCVLHHINARHDLLKNQILVCARPLKRESELVLEIDFVVVCVLYILSVQMIKLSL